MRWGSIVMMFRQVGIPPSRRIRDLHFQSLAPILSRFGGLRRFFLDSPDVVVMQDGVEEHSELAVVLPAVTRIGREQDHPPIARWNVNYGRAIAGFADAAHQ